MSTKDQLEHEAETAKEKLRDAKDAAQDAADDARERAERAAHTYAEQGADALGNSLGDFAHAVRKASDDLETRDQGLAARLVAQAARGLEDAASSVSGTSLDDAMGSLQRFAKRNPMAFTAGAVLAGVALGRVAKASGERAAPDRTPAPRTTGAAPAPAASPSAPGRVGPANPVER